MKTTNTTIIILVITSLFVSCTKDIDNWYNSYDDIYGNNSSNTPGNMGGSTGNLSDFNVAIDSTSLAEDETIPSDDKDYVENFKTTKNIEIKYSNSSEWNSTPYVLISSSPIYIFSSSASSFVAFVTLTIIV